MKEIGIIGFGRFGRFAASLLKRDFQVAVFDTRKTPCPPGIHFESLSSVAGRPVVLLCVPISQIRTVCLAIKPYLHPGQLILDTCSVKQTPLREMVRLLPAFVEIVGTHPLFGPDSARKGIRGLGVVLCPVRSRRVGKIRTYLAGRGLKVFVTTPERHDQEMAKSQALFHFLARGVAQTGIRIGKLSTPGPAKLFQDFKDVQNDSLQLFQDLQTQNRFAAHARKSLIRSLIRLDRQLRRPARSSRIIWRARRKRTQVD